MEHRIDRDELDAFIAERVVVELRHASESVSRGASRALTMWAARTSAACRLSGLAGGRLYT
jgi:hypothetical protein